MKYATIILGLTAGGAAQAHTGHLAEVAGHGHWLGAAALGTAIAIGLWASLKGKRGNADADSEEPPEDDVQEA